METQITINFTTILLTVVSIIMSIFGFFIIRMVKGYDSQIKELFERTKDMGAIKESIEWLKCEAREKS